VRQTFWVGTHFVDLDDLNGQGLEWLANVANVRLHGTTGVAPLSRMPEETLHALPPQHFDTSLLTHRRAGRDCTVHYRGNVYSVPALHAQQMLLLRETEDGRLGIYTAEQILIAEHRLLTGRFQRCRVAAHDAGLPRSAPPKPAPLARQVASHRRDLSPQVEARPLSLYAQLLERAHE
jgi:hypothetical protein